MRYCKFCMNPLNKEDHKCTYCSGEGFKESLAHHLTPYTLLKNRYLVGAPLGEGGFGITYIGRDTLLDIKVAIKEYYPNGSANRTCTKTQEVTCVSDDKKEYYQQGLEKFLNEARIMAKFSTEEGIVNVRDYFEENNTAYIVMEYLQGEDLKDYLQLKKRMYPEEIIELLKPVMLSLQKVHAEGLIHRDISPDNIRLVPNGVKLMDFGAARDMSADSKKSLSIVLKPGYAPEEQYRSRGIQGPWTDVYALCATIYKCITGITPIDATQRVAEDDLKSPSELGVKIDSNLEKAIMKGLAVFQKDRYQSVAELLEGLNVSLPEIDVKEQDIDEEDKVTIQRVKTVVKIKPREKRQAVKRQKHKFILAMILAVFLLLSIGLMMNLSSSDPNHDKWLSQTSIQISEPLTLEDIEVLATHPNLEELILENVSLKDELFLDINAEWPKLKSLKLCNGSVESLQFIQQMQQLDLLELKNMQLDNKLLSTLDFSKMKHLTKMNLSKNDKLSNLKPLTALPTNLHKLDISYTAVDLNQDTILTSPVCANLKILYAAGNQYQNLDFLQHVPLLTNLDVSNNQLDNIEMLKHCYKLKKLNLAHNQIQDLTVLENCIYIDTLHINHNQISNIDVLGKMNDLMELQAESNFIITLEHLSHLKQLQNINLDNNQVLAISPLKESNESIKYLSASNNQIQKAGVLTNMINLEVLHLDGNQISGDINLSKCSQLKDLLLGDAKVILHNEQLEYLDLTNCQNLSNDTYAFTDVAIKHLILNYYDDIEKLDCIQNAEEVIIINTPQEHQKELSEKLGSRVSFKKPTELSQSFIESNTTWYWNELNQ